MAMRRVARWLAVTVMLTGSALADGRLTPAHGGVMAESQGHRLELVARAQTAELYLTDHNDKALSAEGASGKVVAMVNGKKVQAVLQPAGDNRLRGEAAEVIAGFESAVITVERGGQRLSARIAAHH
ncbi:MAG: hypothetical protein HQM03_08325 [Magnetococcales bacterium]|nr:hypothetical protein [Magnetococcales bacterium]